MVLVAISEMELLKRVENLEAAFACMSARTGGMPRKYHNDSGERDPKPRPLGVTRTAFMWRVVDMAHKTGASNILLCKRSFTLELLTRINEQINTVHAALNVALRKSIVDQDEVTRDQMSCNFGSDDTICYFIQHLITLGFDVCNNMARSPDDYLPPKNWTYFELSGDRYLPVYDLKVAFDIVGEFGSLEYEDEMFRYEPDVDDPDFHDHSIMYTDHDTENTMSIELPCKT